MTQSAIAKLERPGANPTVETLERVLRATGTRLEISATPWQDGVDATLIARQLRGSASERIATATVMYQRAREIAGRDDSAT